MRLLWKAHGRASDPVPVLPRGRPAGAIDSPFGAQRSPADAPRSAVHASGGGNLLLCCGIRRAAVASDSDPARGRKLPDRKSTRLNSSHLGISYAVFCLKKKSTDRTLQLIVAA